MLQSKWIARLCIILMAGALFTSWTARRADRQMRRELLKQVQLIAAAIDIELVKSLTGVDAPLDSPDYHYLNAQLASIRAANPKYRYVYLMDRSQEGHIRFLLDAHADITEEPSLPGELYDAASEQLSRLFDTQLPFVEGPIEDEWGVWVSAHAALTDYSTDKTIAVLGVDVDARDWTTIVGAQSALPTILGLTLMAALVMSLAARNHYRSLQKSQDSLRRSEIKFRTVYNLTGDAIMLLDEKGFFDCNETTLKMFGCPSREMFYAMHPADVSPSAQPCGTDSATLANMHIKKAMQNGQNRFEWVHRRIDTGECFPAEVQLSVFELEGRKALQAAVRDISERKQAEEIQRENEVMLFSIIQGLPQPTFIIGRDHKIIHWNRALEELTGFCADDVIGTRQHWKAFYAHERPCMVDLIIDEQCDRLTQWYTKEFRKSAFIKEGYEGTNYFPDLPKGGRWIHFTAAAIRNSKGELVAALEMLEDVTDKAQAQEALRESERKLSALMANLPGMSYRCKNNRDWTMEFVSEGALELTGYSPCELAGDERLFNRLILPEYREELWEKWQRVLAEKGKFEDEYRICAKDGTVKWVWEQGCGVYDENGDVIALEGFIADITARKQAEASLAEEAVRRRILFEESPDGIVVLDENGKVYEANERYAEMLGYSMEDVRKLHVWDWDAQWTRKELAERIRSISITGNHFETRHRRKDGTVYDVEISSNVGLCSGRKLVFCVCRDISDRKQAEMALAMANKNLKTILENAPFGVAIIDKRRTIRWANRAVIEMAGVEDMADLVGQQCGEYLCPAQQNECPILDKEQTLDNSERVLRRKDGKTIPILKTVTEINLDGENVLLETFINITDRKQAEEALIESEKRFRTLFENTPSIAVQGYDRSRNVIFWNRASEELYGYSAAEAFGRKLEDLIIPEQMRSDVVAGVNAWIDGGPAIPASELTLQRADGTAVNVFSSHLLLQNIRGEIEMYCIDIDLTARKQAEQKLQVALAEAETLNRYLEDQTAHANRLAAMAEAANAAKSQFLANMSHEIRTPMNGVIGMTGLLLDTELTEEQRDYAQIVCSCGESLLGLINDILDYSKIEAGRLELEALDFDIRDVLEDFSAMMAMRAHEKGLEFICAANPDVPSRLQGDPGRLRQILTNLTGNAIKFTEHGEVHVCVEVAERGDDDILLRFSVRDTGIGIPEDKRHLLFRSFSQVDASTTRRYGGTGLGLAISKQLAEIMNGEIGVVSEEGKGSEFWFTARLALQPEHEGRHRKPEQFRDRRILVVDDNTTNRSILRVRLTSWGANVAEAHDGPSALERMANACGDSRPFDAAVIDMQMPDMDGLMLGRAIRQDARFDSICLMMMTSLGLHVSPEELAACGFSACLSKPIRISEFYARLTSLLTGADDSRGVCAEPAKPRPHRAHAGTARILLAEDNITNQQVALNMLRRMGLRADAVANGDEAVKALENIGYDLVLMDVQMPEMDGLEATRHIRGLKSNVLNHTIPIIAMTAHAMTGDREECLRAGMNDYISKPVSPKELAEKIGQWLDKTAADKNTVFGGSGAEPDKQDVVFDRDGFLERLMGDADTAQAVIEAFLEDIPGQIESLKASLQAGDAEVVERVAHTIKGAAANIGAEALRALAAQLEEACQKKDADFVRTHWPLLEMQFDRLKNAVQKPNDR